MTTKAHSSSTVALIGVAHSTLLFGRALALAEIPVVGIYDSDPAKALQAALFLGISGQTDCPTLLQTQPSVLLCSQPLPVPLPSSTQLCLYLEHGPEQLGPQECLAKFAQELPEALPTSITSALPKLTLKLVGSSESQKLAADFFEALSPDFETVQAT